MKWVKRILIILGVIVGILLLAVAGILWYLQIPTTAAGMALEGGVFGDVRGWTPGRVDSSWTRTSPPPARRCSD
ncbi:MAG: hypothetical protein U0R23_05920 [Candidatus Nanopelagicales bacterium]